MLSLRPTSTDERVEFAIDHFQRILCGTPSRKESAAGVCLSAKRSEPKVALIVVVTSPLRSKLPIGVQWCMRFLSIAAVLLAGVLGLASSLFIRMSAPPMDSCTAISASG